MTESKHHAVDKLAITFRNEVQQSDVDAVRHIVRATKFFSDAEVDVAVELVEERISKGSASGYEFIFAERNLESDNDRAIEKSSELLGYICYGEIPCTVGSYDIYWIVVSPDHQRLGIGYQLMQAAEDAVSLLNGRKLYIDTSGKPLYTPTRSFYARCGYEMACELLDFYGPDDSKIVFEKTLSVKP